MTRRARHLDRAVKQLTLAITLGAFVGADLMAFVPPASAQRVLPFPIPRMPESPNSSGTLSDRMMPPPLPIPSVRDSMPSLPPETLMPPAARPALPPAPPQGVPRLMGTGPCAPVLTQVANPGLSPRPLPTPGTPIPPAPPAPPTVPPPPPAMQVGVRPATALTPPQVMSPAFGTAPGTPMPPPPAPMQPEPFRQVWEEPPSRIENSFRALLAAVSGGLTSSGPILTRPVPTFAAPPVSDPQPLVRADQEQAQPVGHTAAAREGAGGPPYAVPEDPLRQYGYTTFASAVSTFAPVDDVPVGPDYVLGPGDDLTINIWGPLDASVVRTVDRSGAIVLPKVGDVRVWGLSFAQADRLIREQLARYYKGFQTSVTMGRLRTIRVHVVGEVCQPGVYMLSSLSTVTNALYSAGGPTRLGSLREIRLLRNSHTVGTVDLYDFLLRGDRTRDFRLESGDTIFVATVGEVAAAVGEVKRPGIYELRGETPIAELLDMAGGLTPSSYLRRVQVIRAQPGAERVTVDVDLSRPSGNGALTVRPGDLVIVHPTDPRIYNLVRVSGAVKYPGTFELKRGMRVSQLLPRDAVLPEANTRTVEVARRQDSLALEIVTLDLAKAWSGDAEHDLVLKSLDEVTVRTDLRDVRTVVLTGQVVRPGKYTIAEGERLSTVLARAGGLTPKAFRQGAFFQREALRRVEQERLNEFVKLQEQRFLAAAATPIVGADRDEVFFQQAALQARREMLRSLASRVAVGRVVVKLDAPEHLRGTEHDIVMMDGDRLDVPEPPSSVLVLGAVRTSTSVLYRPEGDLDYYLRRVGGATPEADKKEIHIVKADGSAIASFANVRDIEPGDTIVVPPKDEEKIRMLPTFRDVMGVLGGVLLSVAALAVLF
jgi:protein involved in polysaccharide export with SLBB domain